MYLVGLGTFKTPKPITNIVEGSSSMYHRHEESRVEALSSRYNRATAMEKKKDNTGREAIGSARCLLLSESGANMVLFQTLYTSAHVAPPDFRGGWLGLSFGHVFITRAIHCAATPASVHLTLHALLPALHLLEQFQSVLLAKKGALLGL